MSTAIRVPVGSPVVPSGAIEEFARLQIADFSASAIASCETSVMAAAVHVDIDGHVMIVRLDDPAHHNAYDGATLHAVGDAWAQLDQNDDLRVGVLCGTGSDAFCTGADVEAVVNGGFSDPPYPELAEGIAHKPTIAAIEGMCLGGGMMLAAGCDLRIAGRSATFGLPEARWNYPAQWLGALARQLLPQHAMELAFIADERLSAHRLFEMGWLSAVVDDGDALTESLRWAERIGAQAPGAVQRFRELIRYGSWAAPVDALALGHRQSVELMAMEDTAEAAKARAERRPPNWTGR